MKTLFLFFVQIYLLSSCTCIFGMRQPRPNRDSSNKLSSAENIFKKCQDVNVNIRKTNFLDADNLLCFGLKVFTQLSPGGLEESAAFVGAENKHDNDICKHFQEMRLNPTLTKLNDTVEVYNLLFHNKSSCERACLDVISNVNPLCNIILLLSRNSKGNPIGSDKQSSSNILSGVKVNPDNNVVYEQSSNSDVLSKSLNEQKTKVSGVDQVIVQQRPASNTQEKTFNGQVIVQQRPASNTQEKTFNGQILDLGDESVRQNMELIPLAQTSRRIELPLTDNVGKLDEYTQQTDVNVKGNPEAVNEESTLVTERANEQPSTSGLLKIKDTTKAIKTSKNESKVSNVEDTHSVDDSNNEGQLDSLLQEKGMEPSPVVLLGNSGGDKKLEVTATGLILQEKTSTVKDSSTPKKVDTVTGLKEGESIFQVPNVEKGGIVNGQKSEADKDTENFQQKVAEIQTNNKMITEVTPNSNTDKQRTNQNSQKAETVPQSDKTDTQKTIADEGPIPDDTDDVLETHTPFSAAGEFPEISSGGGTGVYYDNDRPVSDDLQDDKSRTGLYNGAFTNPAGFGEDDDSHFFAYFMTTMVFCIVGYLLFHNKQKILALALEGRARRGRRRPNTSGYRKLDSNLEEAISSSKSASVTQVIY